MPSRPVAAILAVPTLLLAACGGDAGDRGRTEAVEATDRWVARWCSMSPGMTRDDVVEMMGEPTSDHNGDGDETAQLGWASSLGDHSYDFTAYVDSGGVVEALWGNYDDVRPDDVLDLDCGDFRSRR